MARYGEKPQAAFIAPERVYSLKGFQVASGIAATRMREARLQGIECKTLRVGKRVFIRGSDGIAYIERLAELSAQQQEAAK